MYHASMDGQRDERMQHALVDQQLDEGAMNVACLDGCTDAFMNGHSVYE